MQFFIADTSVDIIDLLDGILIEEESIRKALLKYVDGWDGMRDEDHAPKEVINERLNSDDDISGSLLIKVGLKKPYKVTVTPSNPDKNILKCLAKRSRRKVKIIMCLYQRDDSHNMVNFVSTEGSEMTIHPKTFTCTGEFGDAGIQFTVSREMVVKLLADIDVTPPTPTSDSFAKKLLENGSFSDVTISASNGAEIKSHKNFLSVCSPVLEAMLNSRMEETQTGRVDMSDLSEEGVKAFLRFVYYDDMEEPMEDIQVAYYELFYAGHKYNVPRLENKMMTLLCDTKNEDIGLELAFRIFMLTRALETASKLKSKALEILESIGARKVGGPNLESEIETFLGEANHEKLDVAVAFKMYMFTMNSESAVDLKKKALQVLTTKWDEMELLQEYNDLFEKPSNSKTAIQM